MPFITTPERIGIEKGRQEGRQAGLREGLLTGIEFGLKLKFGAEGLGLLPELRRVEGVEKLRAVYQALETATSADDQRRA